MKAICKLTGAITTWPCATSGCHLFGDCLAAWRSAFESKPTNNDRINAMTVEEKADFLNSIAYGRQTPWSEPFYKKFCASCPTVSCTVEGYSKPMDFNECDFVDGKCPHGTDIVWWLNQPAEEDPDGT